MTGRSLFDSLCGKHLDGVDRERVNGIFHLKITKKGRASFGKLKIKNQFNNYRSNKKIKNIGVLD
jgi:hypothetical protein